MVLPSQLKTFLEIHTGTSQAQNEVVSFPNKKPLSPPERDRDATHVDSKVSDVKQMMAVLVSTEIHPMASMRVDHIPTPSAISGSGLLMRDTIL